MAQIAVGPGKGGRRPVDSEIPLIPFIDLLLCCVMFLLVAAVWNEISAINTSQVIPGDGDETAPPVGERLILQVGANGFVLASTLGTTEAIPKAGERYDHVALAHALEQRLRLAPDVDDLTVAPEDGVRFEDIVATMDTATGSGFGLALADGATL